MRFSTAVHALVDENGLLSKNHPDVVCVLNLPQYTIIYELLKKE
jgi:hypothetical protein